MYILFTVIPKLASVLSLGSMSGHIVCMLQMYWFVLSRKTGLKSGDFRLTIHEGKNEYGFYVSQPMDLRALAEVFVDGEYDWRPTADFHPMVIIDLGAHIGDTALFYHLKYPEAQIIAVEASPISYERLVKNVSSIKKITPVFSAIGPEDGAVSFNISESSLGSSVLKRPGITSSVTVPQVTLATLLESCSVQKADLIKFDIEGGEFNLFKQCDPAVYALAYRGELHFDLVAEDLNKFDSIFTNFVTTFEPMQKKGRYLFSACLNNA